MTFHSPTHQPNQTLAAFIRAQRKLEAKQSAHERLCERAAAKDGLPGVVAMRQRTQDALHSRMAAELRAGLKGAGE